MATAAARLASGPLPLLNPIPIRSNRRTREPRAPKILSTAKLIKTVVRSAPKKKKTKKKEEDADLLLMAPAKVAALLPGWTVIAAKAAEDELRKILAEKASR